MMDDQDLGFFANILGIFIFVMVIAYHYVMADPKYEWRPCIFFFFFFSEQSVCAA